MGILHNLGKRKKEKTISTRSVRRTRSQSQSNTQRILTSQKQIRPISSKLQENLDFLTQNLGTGNDLVINQFWYSGCNIQVGLAYISVLVDKTMINTHIIERLKNDISRKEEEKSRKNIVEFVSSRLLTIGEVKLTESMEELISGVLAGKTILFLDNSTIALVIETAMFTKRAIERPDTESTIFGSREGFIEDLTTNVSLLRRRLKSSDLKFENYTIGRVSNTQVKLVWLDGIANPKLIEEARIRLERIDVDILWGSGLIAELIEDKPTSIWPQVHLTERPDKAAADLAEGRFAVLCDLFPFAVIAPVLFWQNLQTADDYAEKPLLGTFYRLLRQGAFYVSMLATPIYIALVSYHQAIIPPPLATRIASGREGVPFPSIVETIILSLTVDLLREAGVRLPKATGGAITFLGAVVIGQAAVTAGFVSPAVIIVVSIAAIANFAIPGQELAGATRIGSYLLSLFAALLGIYGVTIGMVWLLWGVISLRSFGVPLFYPLAPREWYGLKDILVRAPFWRTRKRPSLLAKTNLTRSGSSLQEPKPDKAGDNNDQNG